LFPNKYKSLKNSKVTFENFIKKEKKTENDLIPVPDLEDNFINRQFNSPPWDVNGQYLKARNKYNDNRRSEYLSKKIQHQLHSEKFGGSKPKNNQFILKKLNDILNDKKYTGNTKQIMLILKRYFFDVNYRFRFVGINLIKTTKLIF
jgi:hypothetical protein